MRAAVLFETRKPLEVCEGIEIPTLKPGQVLVELAYSGVCHSQLMEVRGFRGEDRFLPHLLGHEGTGIVRDLGSSVSKVKKGDRVVLGWIKGHGEEAGGVQYRWKDKTLNAGGVTTFNNFAVVSENRLVKLPRGVSMEQGILLGCAIPTGAGIILNEFKPKTKSTIAIYGLGGIGLSALLGTHLFDFEKVICVDVVDEKLKLAKEWGATHTIQAKDTTLGSPVTQIRELTDKQGVDFALDASGLTTTIEQAFQSVKKNGGLCVFASHPKAGDVIKLDPYDLICGKRIQGSWGGATQPDRDLPIYGEQIETKKWPTHSFLDKKYTLDQINQALEDLENKKVARPLIVLNADLK